MTDRYTVLATRTEVNLDALYRLPERRLYRDGYSFNTRDEEAAAREAYRAGADYRVDLYVSRFDGERFQVLVNEGRDNGIGADRLAEMIDEAGSLSKVVQDYTYTVVPEEEIAFYQLMFKEEHHRE